MRSQLGFKEVRGRVYNDFEDLQKKLLLKQLSAPIPDLPPKKPQSGDKKQVEIQNFLASLSESLNPVLATRCTITEMLMFLQRIEAVRRGLEDFINLLLSNAETAGDEYLCAFLEIPPVAALHGLVLFPLLLFFLASLPQALPPPPLHIC